MSFHETQEQFINRCSNASVFNCSVEEYLWLVMGPRRLPLEEIIPISVFLVVIFVTGIAGNVATCVVIVRHPAMHTATNYYLFSLAVSDLLLLLFGLPNDLAVYWHQYPYSLGLGFCKLRALISEAASYVSVLTIVAFSLERYLAICHPLHLYAMAGLHRAVKIIAALWLVSLAAAMPFAVYSDIRYHDYPPNSKNPSTESAFCTLLEKPYLLELSSVCFFIAPGFIMLYLYARMGLRIRSRHGRQGNPAALNGVNGSVHGEARQAKSRKAIIRMLAAVVVAFFVCWAPFHFQRLFFIYGSESVHFNAINEHLFNVAGALYYVSATVNPILYNVMSNRYRVAFRETLCCGHIPRRGSRFYREHSSFRETTVNHCSEGAQLVRVRSMADRRNKLEPRNQYSRSRSAERSSNVESFSASELKQIKPCHEINHVLTNNLFNDKNKRNSKNLAVNFKTNSINDKNEINTNDKHKDNENNDASKISIEIYLDPKGKRTNEMNDISQTIKDLKRNDLITLVGEITNEKTNVRKDVFIVVGSTNKSIEKLCSPELDLHNEECLQDKTETCID